NCARGLGLLGAAASEAEPALLKALKDKDPNVRSEAAEALGRIASDKSRVAPSLIAGLASQDQNHRLASIIGLIHCLPGGAEVAVGTNEIVVWKILGALAEIGPAARPAVGVLKNLTATNNFAATLSIIALGRIEPENPQWIEHLVKRLDSVEGGQAFSAAWEL